MYTVGASWRVFLFDISFQVYGIFSLRIELGKSVQWDIPGNVGVTLALSISLVILQLLWLTETDYWTGTTE